MIRDLHDYQMALDPREARLREYVQGDARCPCCTMTDVCLPDCTFASDSPEGFERMELARAALAPGVKP